MRLADAFAETARRADTGSQQIGADETSRVLACFFDVLAGMPRGQVVGVILQGLDLADERAGRS